MKLDTALRSRRSIRDYQTADVSDAVIRDVLELARHAPSSMNGQPCSFIIVRERTTRERLADIKDGYCPPEKRGYKADMLRIAPVVIVLCVDHTLSYDRALENGVLAAGHLLLAAQGHGLGSVFMTAYRDDEPRVSQEIRQLLDIPPSVDPVALLPLGYPGERPAEKALRPLEEIVFNERHGKRK